MLGRLHSQVSPEKLDIRRYGLAQRKEAVAVGIGSIDLLAIVAGDEWANIAERSFNVQVVDPGSAAILGRTIAELDHHVGRRRVLARHHALDAVVAPRGQTVGAVQIDIGEAQVQHPELALDVAAEQVGGPIPSPVQFEIIPREDGPVEARRDKGKLRAINIGVPAGTIERH